MTRGKTEHDLKTRPEYFAYLWSGDKTFELRKDDRGYWVGDTLLLREWSSAKGYSGRQIKAEVTFVLSGLPWLHKDIVCMSIKELSRQPPPKDEG